MWNKWMKGTQNWKIFFSIKSVQSRKGPQRPKICAAVFEEPILSSIIPPDKWVYNPVTQYKRTSRGTERRFWPHALITLGGIGIEMMICVWTVDKWPSTKPLSKRVGNAFAFVVKHNLDLIPQDTRYGEQEENIDMKWLKLCLYVIQLWALEPKPRISSK